MDNVNTVPTDEQKQDPFAAFKAQESAPINAMINTWPHVSPCPSCGHCPTCGRGKWQSPWNPYPTQPWIFYNGNTAQSANWGVYS
jgi:hypothetical protein